MLLATVAIACLGNYIFRVVIVVRILIMYPLSPNPPPPVVWFAFGQYQYLKKFQGTCQYLIRNVHSGDGKGISARIIPTSNGIPINPHSAVVIMPDSPVIRLTESNEYRYSGVLS